eukprot:364843-Chlamydomonas_euryale.AAC.2
MRLHGGRRMRRVRVHETGGVHVDRACCRACGRGCGRAGCRAGRRGCCRGCGHACGRACCRACRRACGRAFRRACGRACRKYFTSTPARKAHVDALVRVPACHYILVSASGC